MFETFSGGHKGRGKRSHFTYEPLDLVPGMSFAVPDAAVNPLPSVFS